MGGHVFRSAHQITGLSSDYLDILATILRHRKASVRCVIIHITITAALCAIDVSHSLMSGLTGRS